jgi:hypothetical protein
MVSMMSLQTFLQAAARATVILAATGMVATALRRSSASARHIVWVLGLVGALLVPAFSLALPKWEVPIVQIPSSRGPAVGNLPSEAGGFLRVQGDAAAIPSAGRHSPDAGRESLGASGFSREDRGGTTQLSATGVLLAICSASRPSS